MTSMASLRRLSFLLAFSWLGAASAGCGGGGVASGAGGTGGTGGGAGTVALAWDAPTENADGSPLWDLAFYRIYYTQAATLSKADASHVDAFAGTSYDVTGLEAGRYTFAVCAVDLAGNESAFSNTLTVEVQ
jgi:hypothetical protein